MVKIMKLEDSRLLESKGLPWNSDHKACIFLGGLLHLSGLQLTSGLPDILTSSLSEADTDTPIYLVTLRDDGNFSGMAEQMHQVAASADPTPEAREIVDKLLVPDELCAHWKSMSDPLEHMSGYFSSFGFFAYSYGTSLVQQIEEMVRLKLQSADLPVSPLRHVKAMNVGPVMYPMVSLGNVARVGVFANNFQDVVSPEQESGRFRQVFLFKRYDKVMQDAIGSKLMQTDILQSQNPYNILHRQHLTFICENVGDEMIRRFGVGRFPRGTPDPRIDYSYDFEGHSLRNYTNVLSARIDSQRRSAFCIYPSSNIGALVRLTLGDSFKKASIISAERDTMRPLKISESNVQEASASFLDALRQEFDDVMANFRKMSFAESVGYLEAKVSQKAEAVNKNGWYNPIPS